MIRRTTASVTLTEIKTMGPFDEHSRMPVTPTPWGHSSYSREEVTTRQEIHQPAQPRFVAATVLGSRPFSIDPDTILDAPIGESTLTIGDKTAEHSVVNAPIGESTLTPIGDETADCIAAITQATYWGNEFLANYAENEEQELILRKTVSEKGAMGNAARDFLQRLNRLEALSADYDQLQEEYFDMGNKPETLQKMSDVARDISQKLRVLRYHDFQKYVETVLKRSANG